MGRYILNRLLWMIPVILGVLLIAAVALPNVIGNVRRAVKKS